MRHASFLLLILLYGSAVSQTLIKGKVTDPNGEPLIGVTIFNETSKKGAVTDGNGIYLISVNPGDELTFQMIGMKNQTLAFDGQAAS